MDASVPPSTTTTTSTGGISGSPTAPRARSVVVAATSKPVLLRVVNGQPRFVPLDGIRVLGVPATGDPDIARELRRYRRSLILGPFLAAFMFAVVVTLGVWML